MHELIPPQRDARAEADAALALRYVEQCYVLPDSDVYMTPETNIGCTLCHGTGARSSAPAVTDGKWWFAFAVAHYMRIHSYELPDFVLADLRKREFAVPTLAQS